MKVCNSEAMKILKELETQKNLAVFTETTRSRVSYREGEEKRPTNYDYADTRKQIEEIDGKIRNIKHALSVANCTVKIDEFDITIGEALVYLAQLNAEYHRLDDLGRFNRLERRITSNGVIEYTECLYDPNRAVEEQKKLFSTIGKLQVAIDRANLTNTIEI